MDEDTQLRVVSVELAVKAISRTEIAVDPGDVVELAHSVYKFIIGDFVSEYETEQTSEGEAK